MKGKKVLLISLIVVLALSAIVAPISAYSIAGGSVSYDAVNDETTWTYTVTYNEGDKWAISNWVVAWCNKNAVKSVWVGDDLIPKDPDKSAEGWSWDYGVFYGIQGIKVDYLVGDSAPHTVTVKIILEGDFDNDPNNVAYAIKYDNQDPLSGDLNGPLAAVCTEIPEFATIAIPVAAVIGLLFFFNHRKRRNV